MEEVRTYLESSTIHGLAYIATSRPHFVRIIWLLIVIAGFTGAGVIIYQSFQSWDESPVKTTIETRPITELKFPKVTVCPPKNTYTDLNYDLIMTENMTLDSKIRSELTNYSVELLYDQLYATVMLKYDKIVEKDRYFNWYHGYSEIKLPSAQDFGNTIDYASMNGTIFSQYFGDKFSVNNVETAFDYDIYVYTLESVKDNPNATLHYIVEKISMKSLTVKEQWQGVDEMYSYVNGGDVYLYDPHNPVDEDQTYLNLNFTAPKENYYRLRLYREVFMDDVKKQNLEMMPGFRFSWYYSGIEAKPDNRFSNKDNSKMFVRDKLFHKREIR